MINQKICVFCIANNNRIIKIIILLINLDWWGLNFKHIIAEHRNMRIQVRLP